MLENTEELKYRVQPEDTSNFEGNPANTLENLGDGITPEVPFIDEPNPNDVVTNHMSSHSESASDSDDFAGEDKNFYSLNNSEEENTDFATNNHQDSKDQDNESSDLDLGDFGGLFKTSSESESFEERTDQEDFSSAEIVFSEGEQQTIETVSNDQNSHNEFSDSEAGGFSEEDKDLFSLNNPEQGNTGFMTSDNQDVESFDLSSNNLGNLFEESGSAEQEIDKKDSSSVEVVLSVDEQNTMEAVNSDESIEDDFSSFEMVPSESFDITEDNESVESISQDGREKDTSSSIGASPSFFERIKKGWQESQEAEEEQKLFEIQCFIQDIYIEPTDLQEEERVFRTDQQIANLLQDQKKFHYLENEKDFLERQLGARIENLLTFEDVLSCLTHLYKILPSLALQKQLVEKTHALLKELLFEEAFAPESFPSSSNLKALGECVLKPANLKDDFTVIGLLEKLSASAKKIGSPALKRVAETFIVKRMKDTFFSLAHKDPEWRLEMCNAYIEQVNKLNVDVFESKTDKGDWITEWQGAKGLAEQQLEFKGSREHISNPFGSDDVELTINRTLDSLFSIKQLYASNQVSLSEKHQLSDAMILKAEEAGAIRVELTDCDLLKIEEFSEEMDWTDLPSHRNSIYICFEDGLFFMDRSKGDIKYEKLNFASDEEQEKLYQALNISNLENQHPKRLSKTQLGSILKLAHHDPKIPEGTMQEMKDLKVTEALVACELQEISKPIDEMDFNWFFDSGYVRATYTDQVGQLHNELFWVTKKHSKYQWEKVDLNEEKLKEFDVYILGKGIKGHPVNRLLAHAQLDTLSIIVGAEHTVGEEIIGQKKTRQFLTQKDFLIRNSFGDRIVCESLKESVSSYYIRDSNEPVYLLSPSKLDRSIEELDFQAWDNSELLLANLQIYSDLFLNQTIQVKNWDVDSKGNKVLKEEAGQYKPDFYFIQRAFQSAFNLIAFEEQKMDVGKLLAARDVDGLGRFIAVFISFPEEFQEYLFPGLLKLMGMSNSLLLLNLAIQRLENSEGIEKFKNLVFRDSCTINHDDLDVHAIALAYRIISRDDLNLLARERDFGSLLLHMAKVLSSEAFLHCVEILESKTMVLDALSNKDRKDFEDFKLQAEFSKKSRHNEKTYTRQVIQTYNSFTDVLVDLEIADVTTTKNHLSDSNFRQLLRVDQLDTADYAYLKVNHCLNDTQIQSLFDRVGAVLNRSEDLSENLINLIALYMDREDLIKPYLSWSENQNHNEEGKSYLLDLLKPYAERIVEAAKKLQADMPPKEREIYAQCFINRKGQAHKIIKASRIFWGEEETFFNQVLTPLLEVNREADCTTLLFRWEGQFLLNPYCSTLPDALYAEMRKDLDNRAISLDQVVGTIKAGLTEGNREHALRLFIVILDKIQQLDKEQLMLGYDENQKPIQLLDEILQMIAGKDVCRSFAKVVENFLLHLPVKTCKDFLDHSSDLRTLLDKATDDNMHVKGMKTTKASKMYQALVSRLDILTQWANKSLKEQEFISLSQEVKSIENTEQHIKNIEQHNSVEVKEVVDDSSELGHVNSLFYDAIQKGELTKDRILDIYDSFNSDALINWNWKGTYNGGDLSFNKLFSYFLEVYFNSDRGLDWLNSTFDRMKVEGRLPSEYFIKLNEDGQSVLMLAILEAARRDNGADLFVPMFQLLESQDQEGFLTTLINAKDKNNHSILYYLSDSELWNDVFPLIQDYLAADAYLNFGDADGRSYLMQAVSKIDKSLFREILSGFHGESLSKLLTAVDRNEKTILHYLMDASGLYRVSERAKMFYSHLPEVFVESYFHWLPKEAKVFFKRFPEFFMQPYDPETGLSFLMKAIVDGKKETFEWILSLYRGEHLNLLLNATDKKGHDVLFYMMQYQRHWLPKAWIRDYFTPLKDCGEGYTPLHYALLWELSVKDDVKSSVEEDKFNLVTALLEKEYGFDFKTWKKVFSLMEQHGLKPLENAILTFSDNLQDREIAEKQMRDMLRVISGKLPKLTKDEIVLRNSRMKTFVSAKEVAAESVLEERKESKESIGALMKWREKGFFRYESPSEESVADENSDEVRLFSSSSS